jgi:hypothetical protein
VLTQPITELSRRLERDLEPGTYIVGMEDQLDSRTRRKVVRNCREDLGSPEQNCTGIRRSILDHCRKDPGCYLQGPHQSTGIGVWSEGEIKSDFGITVLSPRSKRERGRIDTIDSMVGGLEA